MDQYGRYLADRRTLAAIGTVLRDLNAERDAAVVLPNGLAAAAVAAWERDEVEALASPETQGQKGLRNDAAALALIGLAIKRQADLAVDPVVAKLDASLVGQATAAAATQNI
jgi:hypothetical protein